MQSNPNFFKGGLLCTGMETTLRWKSRTLLKNIQRISIELHRNTAINVIISKPYIFNRSRTSL